MRSEPEYLSCIPNTTDQTRKSCFSQSSHNVSVEVPADQKVVPSLRFFQTESKSVVFVSCAFKPLQIRFARHMTRKQFANRCELSPIHPTPPTVSSTNHRVPSSAFEEMPQIVLNPQYHFFTVQKFVYFHVAWRFWI